MKHPSVYLSQALAELGRCVAQHPKSFIMVSLTVGLVMTTGILRGNVEDDIINLYFEFGSETGDAWRFAQKYFPLNYTSFLPDRYSNNIQRLYTLERLISSFFQVMIFGYFHKLCILKKQSKLYK